MTGDDTADLGGESAELRFQRLVESFVERQRRGELPSITEYVKMHPELGEQIRKFFPALALLDNLLQSGPTGEKKPPAPGGQSGELPLQRLNGYRIVREVGRGGMGIVYEAEEESLGRRVALKVLPFHSLLDGRRLQRFRREAQAAARLEHPSIAPIFGFGEEGGIYYYAMKLIRGRGLDVIAGEVKRLSSAAASKEDRAPAQPPPDKLSTLLARGLLSSHFELLPAPRPPSAAESSSEESVAGEVAAEPAAAGSFGIYCRSVASIGKQVAGALSYAHGEGILHRDIKPSNLILDAEGKPWVTDFGLAKAAGTDDLTQSGEILGTLRYMAPECFEGHADAQSDIYSLGLTLYELLTLRPAYDESDRALLVKKVMAEEPRLPRELDDRIPARLERIVLKAARKEKARRYPSAAELAADLQRFLEGEPVRAESTGTARKARLFWRRRRKGIAWGAGLTTAGLALVLALSMGGRSRGVKKDEAAAARSMPEPAWVSLEAGDSPAALVAADFDGDKDIDLAAGNIRAGTVSLLRNDGGRRFAPALAFDTGAGAGALAAADLDGDKDLDLAAANFNANTVSILVNDGLGGFAPAVNHGTGKGPAGVAAADFDGDLDPDLAVANKVSRSISLFMNLGGGKLAAAAGVDLSAEAFRLAAVDVDGDRRNDLVAVGGEDDVWVLRNDGQGVFQTAGAYKAGPYPNSILAADLDPGGAPDLVVVNAGVPGRQGSGTVSVFRNKGDGSLEAARKYAAGERPLSAAAADLDGDGALDLAVTNQRSDTLSLYLNDGQGAFREPVTLAALKAPSAVVIADLDGDGSPDLAVAHFGSRVVSVLFNDGSGFSGK